MIQILDELLQHKGVLLADGATGSNLFSMGLQTGDSPELWNDMHQDRIIRHYQSFIDAGSDIILTNTFGGTRYRLKLHNAENRVHEINLKGTRLAKQQAKSTARKVIVGGSMGPTGEILQPLGPFSIEQIASAFEEQAAALKEGGADVLWIETMSSREEVEAAVIGSAKTGLPIIVTFSIDTNGRTMMGLAPADIVEFISQLQQKPFAIGVNCGVGASESVAAIINMRHAIDKNGLDVKIVVKANCGVPEYIDGEIVYSGTEEVMSEYVRLAVDAGADIIGGCCGTTPQHVIAMRQSLNQHQKGSEPQAQTLIARLGPISSGAEAQLQGKLSIAAGSMNDREARKTRRRRKNS